MMTSTRIVCSLSVTNGSPSAAQPREFQRRLQPRALKRDDILLIGRELPRGFKNLLLVGQEELLQRRCVQHPRCSGGLPLEPLHPITPKRPNYGCERTGRRL